VKIIELFSKAEIYVEMIKITSILGSSFRSHALLSTSLYKELFKDSKRDTDIKISTFVGSVVFRLLLKRCF
jgi:hypothetical protein